MSEIKLNLLDSHTLLVGTVHGSVGDRLVAALSAEPETIEELEAAFKRFEKDGEIFGIPTRRHERGEIDDRPWDAGILVIDLAARIVACESTYSLPSRDGIVEYHNGHHCTEFGLHYRLSDDWLILRSIEDYQVRCKHQLKKRAAETPLDARAILYGKPLLDFIIQNVRLLDVRYTSVCRDSQNAQPKESDELSIRGDAPNEELEGTEATALACCDFDIEGAFTSTDPPQSLLYEAIVDIHRRWLMTPRDDLNGHSPREILFEKQDLIDSDLDSRMMQWSYFLEEPPCLSRDTNAYRFAGFGTHEWVMYYDLVRFLIRHAVYAMTDPRLSDHLSFTPSLGPGDVSFTPSLGPGDVSFTPSFSSGSSDTQEGETVSTVSDEQFISYLEQLKNVWLSEPLEECIPAEVIDNERRRRPEAMTGRSMVVDEDCPCCKWMGDLSEAGLEITFCHFDGAHMEDEFAFSWFATIEEWEDELQKREQWDREWREKETEKTSSSTDQTGDDVDIPF